MWDATGQPQLGGTLISLPSLALPPGSFARRGVREGERRKKLILSICPTAFAQWVYLNFNGCRLEDDANPPCLTHWPGHGCFWCERSLVGDLSLAFLASNTLVGLGSGTWKASRVPTEVGKHGKVPYLSVRAGKGGWCERENGV